MHTGDSTVDSFIARWGLDAKSQEVLCKLDRGTQMRIISDFAPTDPSRANQMFMGFVGSVKKASTGGKGAHPPVVVAPPWRSGGSYAQGGLHGVEEFISHWALDAKASQKMRELDADTQSRVMADFAPTDPSRASAMFMGFVKRMGGGGRPAPYSIS